MLEVLLARGYFPRELPTGFSTQSYSAAFQGQVALPAPFTDVRPPKAGELVQHNLARAGRMRRELDIPNPALFYPLAKAISDEWPNIQGIIDQCSFSATRPRLNTTDQGRAILPEYPLGQRAALRAKVRAGNRYLVKADIAKLYDSIYTHSIPWAMHTRATAKGERNNDNLLGNRLDRYVRRAQDDQTRGIPTGPDTSFVLAELLLRRIDEELEKRLGLGPLRGFRSVDDYELCFQSLPDAEQALAILQSVLQGYELDVTALKTDIIQLPHWLDEPWTVPLLSHHLSDADDTGRNQKDELLSFFTLAFSLARENPTASVIKYALGRRTRKINISIASWDQYQQLLLQCAVNESDTLSYVVLELEKYALLEYPADDDLIAFSLNEIVRKESVVGLGNAVAWALWGLLLFEIPLTDPASAALSNLDDSAVALIALDMKQRGLAPDLDVGRWQTQVTADGLYGQHWLLAFEAPGRGWLLPAEGDPAPSDPAFNFLRTQGVTFYLPPETIPRQLAQRTDWQFEWPDDDDQESEEYFWNARS